MPTWEELAEAIWEARGTGRSMYGDSYCVFCGGGETFRGDYSQVTMIDGIYHYSGECVVPRIQDFANWKKGLKEPHGNEAC